MEGRTGDVGVESPRLDSILQTPVHLNYFSKELEGIVETTAPPGSSRESTAVNGRADVAHPDWLESRRTSSTSFLNMEEGAMVRADSSGAHVPPPPFTFPLWEAPARGQHPNIRPVRFIFKGRKGVYILAPYAPYSLESVLRFSPLALEDDLGLKLLLLQILHGLRHQRERMGGGGGLLRPRRVLLSDDWWVWLMDEYGERGKNEDVFRELKVRESLGFLGSKLYLRNY